jgi:hypothetical protein
MTVVSVSVESEGWILAVRGTWGATSGSWRRPDNSTILWNEERPDAQWRNAGVDQFPLTPDATPKLVLAVQDAGFDRIGGAAVANSNRPRSVVATRPLRQAFVSNGVQPPLDEFDHGDGTRTIRFALSDRVYVTSTVVSASFLSGWKAGEGGGVISTVTNNSTLSAPLPLAQWLIGQNELVTGSSVDVDIVCAAHHPEHDGANLHQAVAGIRVVAYDGITSVSTWLALRTSTKYGDSVRCWGGAVSLSGLSAGMVTLHYEVYPWVGPVRSTGASHSTSRTTSGTWGTPRHVCYDPGGTRWASRRKYVFVDTTSPNTLLSSTGSVVLHDTIDAARSAPASTKPANLNVAVQKMRGDATTLAGANGTSSTARNIDFWEILITDGQTIEGSGEAVTATSFGLGEGWLVVRGDPAAANPRATCAIQSRGSTSDIRHSWLQFRDCRILMGHSTLFPSPGTAGGIELIRCDVRAKPTYQAGTTTIRSTSGPVFIANCDMRDYLTQPNSAFMRNIRRTAGLAGAVAAVNVEVAVASAGDYAPTRTATPVLGASVGTDSFFQNVRAPNWGGGLLNVSAQNFGDTSASLARVALVNVFIEMNGSVALAVGETTIGQLQDSIFEGCTFIGGRFNFHNDADRNSTANIGATVQHASTTVTIGLMGHGLVTGNSVTMAAFSASQLNGTFTVTVLDANRFQVTVASVISAAANTMTLGTVTLPGGTVRQLKRFNQRNTGNIMRFCAVERNATKHDVFNSDPDLKGSWEVLYGVGYRGNTNANRGTAAPPEFQYAYYGIGSEAELNFGAGGQTDVASWGVNWFGHVDPKNSFAGGDGSLNGDYRAQTADLDIYTPSRLIGKGTVPANLDQDALGGTRAATFAGGALGVNFQAPVPASLLADRASSPQLAGASRLYWQAVLRADAGRGLMVSGEGALVFRAGSVPSTGAGRVLRVSAEDRRIELEPD